MKVLLAYAVTPALWDRFVAAQQIQDRLFPAAVQGCKRATFGHFNEGPKFNLAAVRNKSFAQAAAQNFDWIVCLDADAVMTRPITQWPESGYGSTRIYRLRIDQLPEELTGGIPEHEYGDSSWFVLRRDVFSRFRYCEHFVGYGFEDIDFHVNVLAHGGVHRSDCDARALHLWHQPRFTADEIDTNKARYAARCAERQEEMQCP